MNDRLGSVEHTQTHALHSLMHLRDTAEGRQEPHSEGVPVTTQTSQLEPASGIPAFRGRSFPPTMSTELDLVANRNTREHLHLLLSTSTENGQR